MAPELKWLVFTSVLAGSLWAPYIVGVNVTDFEGKERLFERPPDQTKLAPWVHRSLRAHQNLLEQLLPFSIVVMIGAISGVSTSVTVACSILFFWLRVAHAIGYLAGWIVMLVYAWQILTASPPG